MTEGGGSGRSRPCRTARSLAAQRRAGFDDPGAAASQPIDAARSAGRLMRAVGAGRLHERFAQGGRRAGARSRQSRKCRHRPRRPCRRRQSGTMARTESSRSCGVEQRAKALDQLQFGALVSAARASTARCMIWHSTLCPDKGEGLVAVLLGMGNLGRCSERPRSKPSTCVYSLVSIHCHHAERRHRHKRPHRRCRHKCFTATTMSQRARRHQAHALLSLQDDLIAACERARRADHCRS